MNKRILLLTCEILSSQQIFKDLIIIPCMLNKLYGFETTIAACGIDENLLHEYFSDVKVDIINRSDYVVKDVAEYLKKKAADIDILFMFGGYKVNDLFGQLYKTINPKGKIYIKLDMNRYWLSMLREDDYFPKLLKRADLVTIEDRKLQKKINDEFNCEVQYLRNGYSDFGIDYSINFKDKKNIILFVGRVGIEAKSTEVLVEAFMKADLPDWELRLVGEVEDSFYKKVEKFKDNPKFLNQVKFVGLISDKQQLYSEYRQAKIFSLTSKVEACAHAYSEASANKCYIVSTDVDGISDIKQYSSVVAVDDINGIAEALEYASHNESIIERKSTALQEYVINECSWERIVSRLYLLFCADNII